MPWGRSGRDPRADQAAGSDRPIAIHLLWLLGAATIPVLVLSAVQVWRLDDTRRAMQQNALVEQARDDAERIDDGFSHIQAALSVLAASAALEQQDFAALEREMRSVSAQFGDMSIGLDDADGNQLLSTSSTSGAHRIGLRTGPSASVAATEGHVTLSGVHKIPGAGELAMTLAMPVYLHHPGRPDYVLTSVIPAAQVASMIERRSLHPMQPVNFTLLDQEGTIVSSPFDPGDVVGRQIRAHLLQVIRGRSEGFVGDGGTVGGSAAFVAFAKAPSSGYIVAIGIARDVFNAPLQAALIRTGLIAAALLGASALGAGLLARRLIWPVERLARLHTYLPANAMTAGVDDRALQFLGKARGAAPTVRARSSEVDPDLRHESLDQPKRSGLDGVRLNLSSASDSAAGNPTEAASRENAAALADLLGTLDLAKILVRDPNGTIRFWSHGCERFYGWSSAEAVGQPAATLLQTVFPVPQEEVNAALLRDGEWSGDLVQTCRDGSRITVAVRDVLQRGLRGAPRAIMENVTDVTALRQAEAELWQLNSDLEARVAQEVASREAAQTRAADAERMQALGQLAGGIAHDFNNILQVVAGSAALIERRPGDVIAIPNIIRRIIDSAERGAAITRRMLIFARRGKLEAEAVDPAALLEDLREICHYMLGVRIEIRVALAADLPWLFADKGQLETALVNLATNARDAMPNGGFLTISAAPDTVTAAADHPAGLSPGRYVRLAVSDSGVGMDSDLLARVTEPFFTTKAAGQGTGLGLSMVKEFAETSGGGFNVVSRPESGTMVSLWLPQANDVVASDGAKGCQPEARRGISWRVLLVDDDRLVRETLAAQLEAENYVVVPVAGGEHALSLLKTGAPFDILVTDLALSGMNGPTLIQKARGLRSRLPAILLTGLAADPTAPTAGGAVTEAYSLVRKPVSGSQLADRIARTLEPAAYAV